LTGHDERHTGVQKKIHHHVYRDRNDGERYRPRHLAEQFDLFPGYKFPRLRVAIKIESPEFPMRIQQILHHHICGHDLTPFYPLFGFDFS